MNQESRIGTTISLSVWRMVRLLISLTALWWLLADNKGWAFGALAIVAATAAGLGVATTERPPSNPFAVLRFLVYFFQQSVRGGVDVAMRALRPSLPIWPGWYDYPLSLPSNSARTLFVNVISLLPGTLSVELRTDRVTVHALMAGPAIIIELKRLEAQIAGLFSLRLPTTMGDPP